MNNRLKWKVVIRDYGVDRIIEAATDRSALLTAMNSLHRAGVDIDYTRYLKNIDRYVKEVKDGG